VLPWVEGSSGAPATLAGALLKKSEDFAGSLNFFPGEAATVIVGVECRRCIDDRWYSSQGLHRHFTLTKDALHDDGCFLGHGKGLALTVTAKLRLNLDGRPLTLEILIPFVRVFDDGHGAPLPPHCAYVATVRLLYLTGGSGLLPSRR